MSTEINRGTSLQQRTDKGEAATRAATSQHQEIRSEVLNCFYNNWRLITSDNNMTILKWFKGYKIPFHSVKRYGNLMVQKVHVKFEEFK